MVGREEEIFENLLETVSRLPFGDPVARIARKGLSESFSRAISERNDAERRAKEGNIDVLTGIGNRNALEKRKAQLERAMVGQRRNSPHAVVVGFADMEGLGRFNREHSHAGGDDALKAVAISLSAPFRENEWFRRGGDEFVGLMPVDDEEGIGRVIEKLTQQAPAIYGALRAEDPNSVLPAKYPVVCATRIFRIGGAFQSLNETEAAADPKAAGKNLRIHFSS